MTLNLQVAAVTAAIVARSQASRSAYLQRLQQAQAQGPQRGALGCTNLAHGFAAAPVNDKLQLRELRGPNLAIVSAYNDMLSAHQPLARFPNGSSRRHAALAPPRNSPAACLPCVMA